jgi:hypothetical protein
LRQLVLRSSAIWLVTLAAVAVVLAGLAKGFGALRLWLCGVDTGLVGQIVPAVVVAIFVFAVGTAFVVAQVVPAARGTRAVGVLRGKRLVRTISPTPALLAGSAYIVTDSPFRQEVAVAVLAGALVYTAVSLVALISVLVDATDPVQFKDTLLKKAKDATERLTAALPSGNQPTLPDQTGSSTAERPRSCLFAELHDPNDVNDKRPGVMQEQRATDDLYDIVRTVRGWVRVAARTNDSRELQEALEAFLELVSCHAKLVNDHGRKMRTVPETYWDHATANQRLLNPLSRGAFEATTAADEVWGPWAPPKLVERLADASDPKAPTSDRKKGPGAQTKPKAASAGAASAQGDLRTKLFALPSTWFANEVGRAVVRATELGLEARSLVDRDTLRLLNTLENAALLFAEANPRARSAAEEPARGMEEPGAVGKASGGVATAKSDDEEPDYWPLEWGAGIMIRYLTETGLGVRHAPPDRADWYLEPCIHLADLSRHFTEKKAGPAPSVRRLSNGAATGCLLIADALFAIVEQSDTQANPEQTAKPTVPVDQPSAEVNSVAATPNVSTGADLSARKTQHIKETLRTQVKRVSENTVKNEIDGMVRARKFVPGERLATTHQFNEKSDSADWRATQARLSKLGWTGGEGPQIAQSPASDSLPGKWSKVLRWLSGEDRSPKHRWR